MKAKKERMQIKHPEVTELRRQAMQASDSETRHELEQRANQMARENLEALIRLTD